MRTWVWVPRTHIKSLVGMVATYNPQIYEATGREMLETDWLQTSQSRNSKFNKVTMSINKAESN